jgi:YHS domain-containing protein
MAVCPVCKVEVEEKKARGVSTHKDDTYYFCSKACKKKFDETPEKYAEKK